MDTYYFIDTEREMIRQGYDGGAFITGIRLKMPKEVYRLKRYEEFTYLLWKTK